MSDHGVLGQATTYPTRYDPRLLHPIPRRESRAAAGIPAPPPFRGQDIWNAYELSWLDANGRPRAALAEIVVPGETLVSEGPYRYFRHPNYMVVAGEIFILPMAFGLWWYAVIFGVLNLAVLWWRIRAEDEALKPLREEPQSDSPPIE